MVASVVITPADELIAPLENTVAFGVPKFVRLSRLKISVRNCKPTRSVKEVLLKTDRSTLARPGPLNTPLPRFPYVPAGGSRNAFGSYHCVGCRSSTGPVNDGSSDGRSGFLVSASPDRFEPICGVNGKPLNSVTMVLNCHPPNSLFSTPLALPSQCLPRPKGSS